MDKIALTNVRVFDGDRLLEPATLVIDGDRNSGCPTGGSSRRDAERTSCSSMGAPPWTSQPPGTSAACGSVASW